MSVTNAISGIIIIGGMLQISKTLDAASVLGGKLDAMEAEKADLFKQLEDMDAKVTEAVDGRMKVDGGYGKAVKFAKMFRTGA